MTIKASSLSAKIFHGLSFSINQILGGAMTLNLNRVALARYSGNSADSAKKARYRCGKCSEPLLVRYSALLARYFFFHDGMCHVSM
jgi:hypothetical protein